jgi:hypothetical protein
LSPPLALDTAPALQPATLKDQAMIFSRREHDDSAGAGKAG